MAAKKITSILITVFGFFYAIVHGAFLLTFLFLLFLPPMDMRTEILLIDFLILIFPALGVITGYWIIKRQFGMLRSIFIAGSLITTVGWILASIFVFPKL